MSAAARRPVRRSELVAWEGAAWTAVGVSWVGSAWPGVIVEWGGTAYVPAIALGALAVLVAWQLRYGAVLWQPVSWTASRAFTSDRHPAMSRRSLKISVALDGLLWAGSGVAWCLAARRYGWSESVTGAVVQMGVGVALSSWGLLGLAAAATIERGTENPLVVRRRTLATGPMTVRRCPPGGARA